LPNPLQIVTLKLCVNSRFFCIMNILTILFLSIAIYFGYLWIADMMSFSYTNYTMVETFKSPNFYFTILLTTGTCFIVDLFVIAFKFNFCTSPADLLREACSS
jgi:hypothetical protein